MKTRQDEKIEAFRYIVKAAGGIMEDYILVSVKNWDKFNPRKDIKHPSWFSFSNRMLEDEDFIDFSAEELKAWIYILSKMSQKNTDPLRISFSHANQVCRIKSSVLKKSIEKLQCLGILNVHDRPRNGSVHERDPTDRQTNTQDKHTRPNASAFDVEFIFEGYPKKQGKAKGLKYLKGDVKNEADLEALKSALGHYTKYSKSIDPKFIMKFNNWVTEWRDWIDSSAGKVKFQKKKESYIPLPAPESYDPKPLSPDLQKKLDALKAGKSIGGAAS